MNFLVEEWGKFMSNKKDNSSKGFTLIELVIVIAILAVIALILIPTIGKYTDEANKVKEQATVRTLYTEALVINAQLPFSSSNEVRKETIEKSFTDQGIKGVNVIITNQGTVGTIEYVGDTTNYKFNGRLMKEFSD